MASSRSRETFLFGGSNPWRASDWTASDDRVRGGKSRSHLEVTDNGKAATFWGTLDIKTLGGAGFASQRTVADDANWDLSSYDGLEIGVKAADSFRYTLILKDTLLPPSPNGREQSTVSYEFDFNAESRAGPVAPGGPRSLVVPWAAFKPTYRGREVDAPMIRLAKIKRISIMARSFFGSQEGDFLLELTSIRGIAIDSKHDTVHVASHVSSVSSVPSGKAVPKSKGVIWICESCIIS